MFPDQDNPASTTAGGAAAAAAPEAENAAKDANRQEHYAGTETPEPKKEMNEATQQDGSSSPNAVPQADGDSQSPAHTSSGAATSGSLGGSGSHGVDGETAAEADRAGL